MYENKTPQETLDAFSVDQKVGLSQKEAEARLAKFGPNKLKEAAMKANQKWLSQFLNYLEAPTKAGYSETIAHDPVPGFDTPCPICGAKEPWQDEAQLEMGLPSSPITVGQKLNLAFEEVRTALRATLSAPAAASKAYTGKAILAEKDSTMAIALAEQGIHIEGGEEISLRPFSEIKVIMPSPHEQDKEAVSKLMQLIVPLMEDL